MRYCTSTRGNSPSLFAAKIGVFLFFTKKINKKLQFLVEFVRYSGAFY